MYMYVSTPLRIEGGVRTNVKTIKEGSTSLAAILRITVIQVAAVNASSKMFAGGQEFPYLTSIQVPI